MEIEENINTENNDNAPEPMEVDNPPHNIAGAIPAANPHSILPAENESKENSNDDMAKYYLDNDVLLESLRQFESEWAKKQSSSSALKNEMENERKTEEMEVDIRSIAGETKKNEVQLTDKNAVQKMLEFTSNRHRYAQTINDKDRIYIIKYGEIPIVSLRNVFSNGSSNHPYATLIANSDPANLRLEKELSYNQIGQRLADHHDLPTVKAIAGIVLKMFRSKPIEDDLAKLLTKFKHDDLAIKNIIDDIALLSGALACEIGRGHTAAMNFFTTLEILKYLNQPSRVEKFSPSIAAKIRPPVGANGQAQAQHWQQFRNNGYKNIIKNDLFSNQYGTSKFKETSIGVGFKKSQRAIKEASQGASPTEVVKNLNTTIGHYTQKLQQETAELKTAQSVSSATSHSSRNLNQKVKETRETLEALVMYKNMYMRDINFVATLTDSGNPEKNELLEHTAEEAISRKVNQHVNYLKKPFHSDIDDRIIHKIIDLFEENNFEMSSTLLKQWGQKGYLKSLTMNDIDCLNRVIREKINSSDDPSKVLKVITTLCESNLSQRQKERLLNKDLLDTVIGKIAYLFESYQFKECFNCINQLNDSQLLTSLISEGMENIVEEIEEITNSGEISYDDLENLDNISDSVNNSTMPNNVKEKLRNALTALTNSLDSENAERYSEKEENVGFF